MCCSVVLCVREVNRQCVEITRVGEAMQEKQKRRCYDEVNKIIRKKYGIPWGEAMKRKVLVNAWVAYEIMQ